MTVILLLAGFDSCKEASAGESNEKKELCKTENGDHDEEPPCAPFCHCVRCPFSIVIPVHMTNLHPIRVRGNEFDFILPGKPTNVSFSIWQPPKHA